VKKIEQKITTEILKWIKHNWKESSAIEVKVARDGKRFPLRELYDHQIRSLLRAKHGIFKHKIADLGNQNPFDVFTIYKGGAYVFLYYAFRGNKTFYAIDVDKIVNLKVKSITQQEAKDMADVVGVLK
jgi:penicillin-binding protein-related factor A (putative recombinase)